MDGPITKIIAALLCYTILAAVAVSFAAILGLAFIKELLSRGNQSYAVRLWSALVSCSDNFALILLVVAVCALVLFLKTDEWTFNSNPLNRSIFDRKVEKASMLNAPQSTEAALEARDGDIDRYLQFFCSGQYSDFTIRLGKHEWKVHRIVIAKSGFFRVACQSAFKEASQQMMTLCDDNPAMVTRMLIFLYADDYPTTVNGNDTLHKKLGGIFSSFYNATEDDEILSVHAAMYGMGEKYDIASLKDASRAKYVQALKGTISVDDFTNSIKIAYATTPAEDDGLRKWAVYRAQEYVAMYAREPAFEALIRSNPDFAFDFGSRYARRDAAGVVAECTVKMKATDDWRQRFAVVAQQDG